MARGDFVLFEQFAHYLGQNALDTWQLHNSDSIRLGIVDETAPVPVAASADPTWDDFSGNEVSFAGGYTEDGIVLTTPTYTEVDGVAKFDADNITIVQDAVNGFENAYWGILYNYTLGGANGLCIGFLDFAGAVSEKEGPIVITWSDSGIFTVTITP